MFVETRLEKSTYLLDTQSRFAGSFSPLMKNKSASKYQEYRRLLIGLLVWCFTIGLLQAVTV